MDIVEVGGKTGSGLLEAAVASNRLVDINGVQMGPDFYCGSIYGQIVLLSKDWRILTENDQLFMLLPAGRKVIRIHFTPLKDFGEYSSWKQAGKNINIGIADLPRLLELLEADPLIVALVGVTNERMMDFARQIMGFVRVGLVESSTDGNRNVIGIAVSREVFLEKSRRLVRK